jgi:hypothetical protein
MRKVKEIKADKGIARIFFESEWEEYQVFFYNPDGDYVLNADFYTDDKQDAIDTAKMVLETLDARKTDLFVKDIKAGDKVVFKAHKNNTWRDNAGFDLIETRVVQMVCRCNKTHRAYLTVRCYGDQYYRVYAQEIIPTLKAPEPVDQKQVVSDLDEALEDCSKTRDRAHSSIMYAIEYCEKTGIGHKNPSDAAAAVNSHIERKEKDLVANAVQALGMSPDQVRDVIADRRAERMKGIKARTFAGHSLDYWVAYCSAFGSFLDLVDAKGGYFPSLDVSDEKRLFIADCYDEYQRARGDDRRAYRYGKPPKTEKPDSGGFITCSCGTPVYANEFGAGWSDTCHFCGAVLSARPEGDGKFSVVISE